MMLQKGRFRYGKGPGYAVVALPYAQNRFAMYCFLPDKGGDLGGGVKKDLWSELCRSLRQTEGTVALPKFKLQYGAELDRALSEMGLGIAFDAGGPNSAG